MAVWLVCFCYAGSSKSKKTCSDKELKYGGIVRLNAHALSPDVVLRKVKEYENKANIHFARVSFTFNGKFTEKTVSKNDKRGRYSKKKARKEDMNG